MNVQDLQKLNSGRRKSLLCIILTVMCFICCMFCFIFANKIPLEGLFITLLIIAMMVFTVLAIVTAGKIEDALTSYAISQCPGWEELSHYREDRKKFIKKTFLRDMMFQTIFPVYHNKYAEDDEPYYEKISFHNDNDSSKCITEAEYCEYERHTYRDKKTGKTEEKYEVTAQFNADIILIKNTKNLNSVTYFRTNNYPAKTDKKIIEERSKLELPKIELANAAENNIDVYGNNPSVAEKLATKELCSALQSIKEQFKPYYVKAVFYNDHIIFALRNADRFREVFPLYIKIPKFKSIDYQLVEQAVNNFKTLTDLADKAPEFTKNI